ncbi:hypothetical protein IF1G_06547 [Cordyceps javanica]|uniref:Uncharacterized protein n=1 Tax=Cordyceps javanica TaxID=43265 RepID=A0A545UYK8_9HYPO|nr:hypothetical protein IF1G_06547 [Cordyceps javanica]
MASAHSRHCDTLEHVINSSSTFPLTKEVRDKAKTRFYAILHHFRDYDPLKNKYDRTELVRHTYEHALTTKAKDNLLQALFKSIKLPLTNTVDMDLTNKDQEHKIWSKLAEFADYLLHNFFLPCDEGIHQTNPSAIPSLPLPNTKHTCRGPIIRRNAIATISPSGHMPNTRSPPMCDLPQL